jgi:TPR repeat protein
MDCADDILTDIEAGGITMSKVLANLLIGLMLTVSGGSMVCAEPLEDGVAAYDRGDYATALRLLQPLAEQGNVTAQIVLGSMYDAGIGVIKDDRKALQWYRLAAEQGNADAQFNLGDMYANGQGVTQDDREAVKWLRLAAEQGNASAQSNLGVMYRHGRGVTQDYLRAHMWFNLAASKLIGENGQVASNNRDRIAKSLKPTQVVQAQEMAKRCEVRSFKNCD